MTILSLEDPETEEETFKRGKLPKSDMNVTWNSQELISEMFREPILFQRESMKEKGKGRKKKRG